MKTIIFLILSITATAQTAPYKVAPGPGPYVIKGKGYINLILEPVDTATWEYAVTRKKVVTPPTFPAQIKVEAESSTITTNVEKLTDGPVDHKGYIRPSQGWLSWSATYTVNFAKQNKILFVFANGNDACAVSVNISGVVKTFTLPMTGTSWANAAWQSYSFDIGEQVGGKAVTVTFAKGINVDYITFR